MVKMDINEKLDPKHTALIVIDIQNDFCSPEGALGKRGRDFTVINNALDKLDSVIKSAKASKVLTLYTQQVYDPDKINDLQREQYELDGKLITCDINTDGYKFYNMNPPEKDVYIKHNFNIFSNIDLQKRLEENNIKTLVITGVDTQFCVETAVRNGYDLGYKMVLIEDCIGNNTKNKDFHDNTIALVRKSYGVVLNSSELIEIWQNNK